MKKINFVFLSLLTTGLFSCDSKEEKETENPNILLITADDLGFHVGCYGDSIAKTPNIDQLAEESMRFTNACITQASCSPSRSSIFTGLYPHQSGQVGLSHRGFTMVKNIPNIFSFFNAHGYRTGIIGKLHVQPEEDFPFDYSPGIPTRDVMQVAKGAKKFIDQNDKPFLLSVNYSDPHKQFDAPDLFPNQVKGIPKDPYKAEDVEAFDFQQINEHAQKVHIAGYYNCVARLDKGIGALLEVFREANILKNTILIFLGDHGPPFTRAKLWNYESSVNVPFIVRYPGKVAKGSVSTSLISSIDIFPTLLDLTGFSPEIDYEGKSLSPVFSDPEHDIRDYQFTEFTFHTHFTYFPRRTIRDKRFKLIHNVRHRAADPFLSTDGDKAHEYSQKSEYEGSKVEQAFNLLADPPEYELYDLKNDLYEFNNLASKPKYQDKLNELKERLYQWRKETHDPLLYPYIRESVESFEKSDRVHLEN